LTSRTISKVALALFLAALTVLCSSPLGAASAARDARLVSSTGTAVVFEVLIPAAEIVPATDGRVRVVLDGFGTFSPAGAVELPGKTYRIAIPAEGEPRVFASVIEEENLGSLALARVAGERFIGEENGVPVSEEYYPPDPWKDGGAPPVVVILKPSFMGRQRILPVRVNPLVLDERGARLARRISISVTFEGAPESPKSSLAAEAPLSGTWKRLYSDLLVNPDDVSRFRKSLARPRLVSAPGEAGRRLKIRIPETGLYSIRADSLIAAGLSAGLSTGMFALRKIYFDAASADLSREVAVPVLIAEDAAGAPGILDGGDLLIFHALGIKDDTESLDTDALYTDANILWLEEETAGAAMGEGAALPSSPGAALPQGSAVMNRRKDSYYMKNVLAGDTDFYFLTQPNEKQVSIPFTLQNPAVTEPFAFSLRMAGNDRNPAAHTLVFSIKNATGTHEIGSGAFTGMQKKTFSFSDLPGSWLAGGASELLIATDTDYMYLVNDFRIDFSTLFALSGGMLEFAVGPFADVRTIEISGFTANRGFLIDITDPRAPLYHALAPGDFVPDGGGYKISLNLEAPAVRRFVAVERGKGNQIPVKSVLLDTPSHLREAALAANVMVISHKNFLQRIGEYVAWKGNQGWRIMAPADVEDVFDEFNGGLPSTAAIKRFIDYGVEHWGTEFVILVGDGSEDHKRIFLGDPPDQKGSPPDYVPSFTYCVSVSGELNDEVVASDKWYEFLDDILPVGSAAASAGVSAEPSGAIAPAAFYPDVIVGRIPVGSDVELRAILNKMYRFETPDAGDAWRRRLVLFADDAWSGRGTDYRYRSFESEFESSTDDCRAIVETSLPGGFDVEKMYLSLWTNPIHPNLYESGPTVFSKAIKETRGKFTPALVRELNEGCLYFAFQGHANRSVLTTESGFATYSQYDDADSIRTSIPHVFIGIGCHISEFARSAELNFWTTDGPNGDCMSEQLLFKPGAGAIGTYASDGFEYLSQNAVFSERLFKNLFQTPPADSVEPRNEYTGAHLILSEALTKAEIEQCDQTTYGIDQVLRHHLLGDPLLRVDPGPPLMRLQADWGAGFRDVSPDSVRPRGGTNAFELRLTVSDIVAIGRITLHRNGHDVTSLLELTALSDPGLTYARSYQADYVYTADPNDELLAYKVFSPDGREVGSIEIPARSAIRLFYNDYLEILPNVESPPSGTFRLTLDLPAYLEEAPVLSIDGLVQHDVQFIVPDPENGLHWEAVFERTLKSGVHVFTVTSGDFTRDFTFNVTGGELVASAYSFPNPFSGGTNIVYTLNLPADNVSIDLYNVSGVLIRSLDLPPDRLNAAGSISPHSVLWDGRDVAGDRVANGTYIYVVRIERGGESIDIRGKSVKLE